MPPKMSAETMEVRPAPTQKPLVLEEKLHLPPGKVSTRRLMGAAQLFTEDSPQRRLPDPCLQAVSGTNGKHLSESLFMQQCPWESLHLFTQSRHSPFMTAPSKWAACYQFVLDDGALGAASHSYFEALVCRSVEVNAALLGTDLELRTQNSQGCWEAPCHIWK